MDELSSVLGDVLRALGMEDSGRVRLAGGAAESRRDPGDHHDLPEDPSGG
jgi:hypothetical protein